MSVSPLRSLLLDRADRTGGGVRDRHPHRGIVVGEDRGDDVRVQPRPEFQPATDGLLEIAADGGREQRMHRPAVDSGAELDMFEQRPLAVADGIRFGEDGHQFVDLSGERIGQQLDRAVRMTVESVAGDARLSADSRCRDLGDRSAGGEGDHH